MSVYTMINATAFTNLTSLQVGNFTEIPTATTSATFNVSTRCATTEFCKNIIDNFTATNYLNDTSTQNITGPANIANYIQSAVIGGVSGTLTVAPSASSLILSGVLTMGGVLQGFNTNFKQIMTTTQLNKSHIYKGTLTGLTANTSVVVPYGTNVSFSTAPTVMVTSSGSGGTFAFINTITTTSFVLWTSTTTVYWVAIGN